MTDQAVNVTIGAKLDDLIQGFQQAASEIKQSAQTIQQSVQTSMNQTEQAANEATNALQRTEREAAQAGNGIMGSLGGVTGFLQNMLGGILAGFSLQAAVSSVLQFADSAESLLNTAQIVDMTATSLSRLHATATPMGMTAEQVDKGMIKLAKNMTELARGSDEAAAAFEAVGLSADEVKNMSIEQVLATISDRFSESEDGATKTALAMALLGKSGAELVPWLNQGSKAMTEAADAAEEMGAVMGEDAVAAGAALDDAMDTLTMAASGTKKEFQKALAPALQFVAECFTDGSGAATDFSVVFKGVSSVVIMVTGIIKQSWAVVSGIVAAITTAVASSADTISKMLQGDFQGALDAAALGRTMIKETLGKLATDYMDAGAKMEGALSNVWNGVKKPPDVEAPNPKGQLDFKESGGGGDDKAAAAAKKASEEAKRAAQEAFDYKMELLRNELGELDRGSVEKLRIASQMAEAVKAQYGEQSREYARALGEQARILEEVEAEKRRITELGLVTARDRAQHEIAIEQGKADYLVATGQMSATQRAAFEREAAAQTYAMQLAFFEQKMALYASEPQIVQQVQQEIERLKQEHQLKMQEIDLQNFEVNKQQWDTYFQSITDGFANAIQGMVFQGLTLREAMGNILQSILGQLIQTGVKMVAQWAATQLGMTSATVTGAAVRTAAETASAKQSVIANAGAAIKNIMTKGAEVFANVYNAIAGIPYVGPFLAPVMAVAATAAVVGYVGKVASAEGGWDRVPYDGARAILHKEEMVLPAPLAEGIRGMVERGDTMRGGGVHIHALDRRDVQRYFDDNGDIMVRALAAHSMNNPGGF